MTNSYEQQAREKKVAALVKLFEEIGITADEAANAMNEDANWNNAAAQAGVNPPSLETRKAVVAAMREREGRCD